jgi:hypothetical protein
MRDKLEDAVDEELETAAGGTFEEEAPVRPRLASAPWTMANAPD